MSTENAADRRSSANDCYVVSLGARMWVETVKAARRLVALLPDDDREDVLKLLPELWCDDSERVEAAERALHEIIDDPEMTLIPLNSNCERCGSPLEMSRDIDSDGNVTYYGCDCAT